MSSSPSTAIAGFKVMSFSEFNDAQTQLMERITGPPAAQLIPLSFILSAAAAASKEEPLKVLDICSGAGTVPDRLFKALGEGAGRVKVVSTDIEEQMVELARKRAEVQGWTDFEAQVADGQALPFQDASFDYVFCCFGPQFFQNALKGVAEAARVLVPGGRYSYTAWTSPGFVPFLLRAAPALTPIMTPMFRKPCSVRSWIPSLLSGAGFDEQSIKIEDVVVPYRFEGPEDFIEQMKWFPGPLMANEERCEKMKAVMREDFGEGAFTLDTPPPHLPAMSAPSSSASTTHDRAPILSSIPFGGFDDTQRKFMERMTGAPAVQLVQLSGVVKAVSSADDDDDDDECKVRVLDVCSGPGIVVEALMSALEEGREEVRVVSTDIEEGMVELAKKRARANGWGNVATRVADGTALPFEDASFDFVFCNFGPQFFPNLEKGLSEAARVLSPTGTYAYTAWTSPGFVPFLLRAEPSLSPLLLPMFSSPCAVRSSIPSLLAGTGFDGERARIEDVMVRWRFEGADEFVSEMQRFPGPMMKGEARQEKLKRVMREDFGEDGFELEWKGVAVVAKKRA